MRFDANIAASGTISAPFGSFDSLTVSGQPVSTGTGSGASIDPAQDQTITGNWDFQSGLTKNTIAVATVDDLFVPSGTVSVVSGTIIRPLGTAHSPLGLWTFDGDLTDSSGNGNTLTAEVGTVDIARIGPYLSGAKFEGNGVLVAADDAAFKITGDMTIEAIIVYAADTVAAATKVIAGQSGPSGDGVDADNYLSRVHLNTTDHVAYFAEAATGTNISFTSTEEIAGLSRTMHHVAMVRENDDVTIYVDGRKRGTSSGLIPPVGGGNTRFRIGGDIGTASAGANFFTGVIASVKYIGFALNEDQVRREYESTLATSVIPEEFTTVSGAFTHSLTVSGVPVNIGASGGGSSIDESQVALISQVFGS